ncbi:protein FLOWERING LOCUS T 1-like [Nicotiana tabacum]|uniref:Protein FLOWERING LOCUS T 1-like n=1 Tax=Nicotiana tabacum TaxID=4097 RepID=A0AC58SAM3_TOBAC
MSRGRDTLVLGRVIGDVLDPFTKSIDLRVVYSSRQVINGCDFRPSQVIHQPRIDIGGADNCTFYTLVMVDPDAPTPTNPNMREYLHWSHLFVSTLLTDIPAAIGVSFGNEVVSYESRGSPRPTIGIHRFVFVLFLQLRRENNVYAPQSRQNFNTRDFAELYDLGLPVAAVYFNGQRKNDTGGRRL